MKGMKGMPNGIPFLCLKHTLSFNNIKLTGS